MGKNLARKFVEQSAHVCVETTASLFPIVRMGRGEVVWRLWGLLTW